MKNVEPELFVCTPELGANRCACVVRHPGIYLMTIYHYRDTLVLWNKHKFSQNLSSPVCDHNCVCVNRKESSIKYFVISRGRTMLQLEWDGFTAVIVRLRREPVKINA